MAEAAQARGRLRAMRWYSSSPDAPLLRRPTDVVLLVLSLLGLVALGFVAPGPTQVDKGLSTAVSALPDVVAAAFRISYSVAAIWAGLLLIAMVATPRRRLPSLHLLLAAAIALGAALLAGAIAGTAPGRSWDSLLSPNGPPVYTEVRVAVVCAVIVAASPHLAVPVRLVGRVLLLLLTVAAVVIGTAYPSGAVAGLLVGLAAGAGTHLLLGSPGGTPSRQQVKDALSDLGLDATDVVDVVAVAGSSTFAAAAGGRALRITVLGRDEWDARAFGSVWTAATRRGARLGWGATRLQRIEHAAMVSLLAQRAGVPVLPVVVAGRSSDGDAVLVTEAPDGVLSRAASDGDLDAAWSALTALHDAGLAHGAVDSTTVVVDAHGRIALAGFLNATVAADRPRQVIDRARLLVESAILTDIGRAVAAASRSLGTEGLGELLPYVQPAVLDRRLRARAKAADWDLTELRSAASDAAGVEPPALEQLRRVTPGALLRFAIMAVLAYGLLSLFSNVDFASLWSALQGANWWWLGAALLVAPLAQVCFAFSTMGSTMASIRYFPTLMLQYAVQFLAVCVPSTGARIAMDVRFFQSFGVAGGAAVSMGMIDSFSGFIVQIVLLAVILLSGLPGFTTPVSESSSSSSDSTSSGPSAIAIMLAIAVVSLVVVLVVPTLRHRFGARLSGARQAVREQLHAARGALEVVRHPAKLAQMLLGNLGAQVVQAVALGLCLFAFGQDASLSQLVLINTAVSLFAGLMPVPGGVGVAEAGYTAGLMAVGVPNQLAISTAIAFRMVTFYLPPLWGALSMRWLRRHEYL